MTVLDKKTNSTARNSKQVNAQPEQRHVKTLRPAVDIYENESCISIYTELPGVAEKDLQITLDKDTLALEAKTSDAIHADSTQVVAEFQSTHYQRRFALSNDLDTDTIEAKLNHGILALTIHKKQSTRARKIEVKVA